MSSLKNKLSLGLLAVLCAFATQANAADAAKIGVVNFRKCADESKLGKLEQENFEAMKKQMETALSDKEKKLNEIANKLNDADYLDSISPEAETDLKREFRAMSQEMSQVQNQYYQTLQQAHYKILQKISESVAQASERVAKQQKLDIIVNEESSFYFTPVLDVSSSVITEMDSNFAKESKK